MSNIIGLCATSLEAGGNRMIGNLPVYFTGVGKINAAMNTERIIEKFKPDLIINFGSCGSLRPGIEVGKLLRVGKVFNDIDCSPTWEYGETPFDYEEDAIRHLSDTKIECITSDRFYQKHRTDYSKYFLDAIKRMDIVDMELFAIATVCDFNEVPLVSYKWVSDDGDLSSWKENAMIGLENFEQKIIDEFE